MSKNTMSKPLILCSFAVIVALLGISLSKAFQAGNSSVRLSKFSSNPKEALQDQSGTQIENPQRIAPSISFVQQLPLQMSFSADEQNPDFLELTATQLDEAAKTRISQTLVRELGRYPDEIAGLVSKIFVGESLKFKGEEAGGMHFLGLVFIAIGPQDQGLLTDSFVARVLHHEVSHAVLDANRSRFPTTEFREQLPPTFVYTEEASKHTRVCNTDSDQPSFSLLQQGFLRPWAVTSMDEDFCSYAELLMQSPELIFDTFCSTSRVGRKAELVRNFYLSIDPEFAQLIPKR